MDLDRNFTAPSHANNSRNRMENEFAKRSSPQHLGGMSTVEEIKAAIGKLSLAERAEILADLCEWNDDDWDRQMKRDVATGKFATLNREADTGFATGQTRTLNEILREP